MQMLIWQLLLSSHPHSYLSRRVVHQDEPIPYAVAVQLLDLIQEPASHQLVSGGREETSLAEAETRSS